MSDSNSFFETHVFPSELEQIKKRREVAGLDASSQSGTPDASSQPSAAEANSRPSTDHGLVGLALSGGGIRSALFNLGLLQAFSHRGLLRYVDYLSSVSGGGYVAGHLAELTVPADKEEKNFKENFHATPQANLDCHPENHRDTRRTGICRPEGHLSGALKLITAWIPSVLLHFALYLSLMGILSCLAALLWRSFDSPDFRRRTFNILNGIPAGDEALSAAIPAIIFAIVWASGTLCVVAWRAVSNTGKPRFRFVTHRLCFILFCLTLAISATVFLSNGVTAVGVRNDRAYSESNSKTLALWLGVIAGAVQILSAVGIKPLLRSGREQAPLWQKVARHIVSVSLLIVPALAMLFLMARDNVSHFADVRKSDLLRYDSLDDLAFCDLIATLMDDTHKERIDATKKLVFDLQCIEKQISGRDRHEQWQRRPIWTLQGNYNVVYHLLSKLGDDGPIDKHNRLRSRLDERVCNLMTCFNKVLPSPTLTHALLLAAQPPEESESVPVKWVAHASIPDALVRSVEPQIEEASERLREGKRLKLIWGQMFPDGRAFHQLTVETRHPERIADFNRLLLEAFYPEIIRERTEPSSYIVNAEDQKSRWWWLVMWIVVGLLSGGVLFVTRRFWPSPLYEFYREALIDGFLRRGAEEGERTFLPTPLAELKTCERGMPYQLFVGARMRPVRKGGQLTVECEPFVFSKLWCGLVDSPEDTAEYSNRTRTALTVADAVTISGAALTPLMTNNVGLMLLMWLFNLRLERQLPFPTAPSTVGEAEGRSTQERGDASAQKLSRGKGTPSVYVADGGFREFFGLEELLRRRCRIIIVSDAGCNNGKYELGALARTVRMARSEMGIEFLDLDHDRPFDVDRIRRVERLPGPAPGALAGLASSVGMAHKGQEDSDGSSPHVPQQIMAMRIRYAHREDGGEAEPMGMLFYVQMSLSGTEDVDLQQIRKIHPNFPDESTLNQFFTGEQSESYRQLGYHIASKLCFELPVHSSDNVAAWTNLTIKGLEDRLLVAYQQECYREQLVDSGDIDPLLLMTAASDIDTNANVDWGEFDYGKPGWAEKVLHAFETDAEFRRVARRQLVRAIEPPLGDHGVTTPYEFKQICLPLTILCCHELVNGPVPACRRVFQVGGRRRLTTVIEWLPPSAVPIYQVVLEFKHPLHANDHLDWKKRLYSLVAHEVFAERGLETATILEELLTRGLLRAETIRALATRRRQPA